MSRRGTRGPIPARDWIEAAAGRLLACDPAATAARLEVQRRLCDELAGRLAAFDGPDDADRPEFEGRLARVEATVAAYRGLERALASTRPLVEAAERMLAAAKQRESPPEDGPGR